MNCTNLGAGLDASAINQPLVVGTSTATDGGDTADGAAKRHPASFRDPSGFVFRDAQGTLLRQVNNRYRADYEQLFGSGLYESLTGQGRLIDHIEVGLDQRLTDDAFRVVQPTALPFISYPYEWCFGQLKDAALLTLDIQKEAMKCGMTLKDASSYNVQFVDCRPVFIDTLSFENYTPGTPWSAYRQFCQHFLAPLALMAWRTPGLNKLLVAHLDGVPLELAAQLLPIRARTRLGLLMHLFLHARSQRQLQGTSDDETGSGPPRTATVGCWESWKVCTAPCGRCICQQAPANGPTTTMTTRIHQRALIRKTASSQNLYAPPRRIPSGTWARTTAISAAWLPNRRGTSYRWILISGVSKWVTGVAAMRESRKSCPCGAI